MEALELMERLGGEILANKVRARIDGEIVIIAELDEENEWVYTEKGQILANEHSNLAVSEAAAPKTRKKGLAAVESVEAPAVETPAEQAPVAE
jgi:hypothetical protein